MPICSSAERRFPGELSKNDERRLDANQRAAVASAGLLGKPALESRSAVAGARSGLPA